MTRFTLNLRTLSTQTPRRPSSDPFLSVPSPKNGSTLNNRRKKLTNKLTTKKTWSYENGTWRKVVHYHNWGTKPKTKEKMR